jgi:hypothetical protein
MTHIVVASADKDAKLHEKNGKLLMYVGRITVSTDNLTVTPVPQHHRQAVARAGRLGADG